MGQMRVKAAFAAIHAIEGHHPIYHQLKTEPPGPKRSRLVNEAFRLHYPR